MDKTPTNRDNQDDPVVAPEPTGADDAHFYATCQGYRPKLLLHCYRLLGSLEEAESQVAKALRRALRARDSAPDITTTSPDRLAVRPLDVWLHGIATRGCAESLGPYPRKPEPRPMLPSLPPDARAPRRPPIDIRWLQPIPDRQLDQVAPASGPGDAGLAGTPVSRECVDLRFVAALQQMSFRQRAVFTVVDVLQWPVHWSAAMLEAPESSTRSLLHRARQRREELLPGWRSPAARVLGPTEPERAVLERFVTATERGDPSALRDLVRPDAWLTMPPCPEWLFGRDPVIGWWEWRNPVDETRLVTTAANRQPAVATYVRSREAGSYQPDYLHVLRIEDDQVAEITSFLPTPPLLNAFRLPASR